MNHPTRAFTLLEALVAVALIAVLSILAGGALHKATDRAAGVKCLMNLRNIGIAVQLYPGENKGRLPVPANGEDIAPDGGRMAYWSARLAPYLFPDKSIAISDQPTGEVLRCPKGEAYRNYGKRFLVTGYSFGAMDYTPLIISNRKLYWTDIIPDQSVLFVEKDHYQGGNLFPSGRESHFNLFITERCRQRHGSDGINVLYASGRVEYLVNPTPEKLTIKLREE